MALDAARERVGRLDAWLRAHPIAWFILAVLVPGLAVAGFNVLLAGRPLTEGLLYGLAFGLVYATLTYVWGGGPEQEE